MKAIVMCGKGLGDFQKKVADTIIQSERHEIIACLIDERPPKSLSQRLWKNLKKGRGGYVLVMGIKSLFAKAPKTNTRTYFKQKSINVIGVADLYSDETIQTIRSSGADILILLDGFGIIGEPILSLLPFGIISYHQGDMRKYRGQPFAFWELYNGETEMGLTVQRLCAGLDRGEAIVEKNMMLSRGETFGSAQKRAVDESIGMILEALDKLSEKGKIIQISEYGKLYTIPNLSQWLVYVLRTIKRRLIG